VRFVPVGQRTIDPAGYFRTGEFHRSMSLIKDGTDVVIVDAPPILAVAETSAIAAHVDGIVLVVTRGTRLSRLEEVRQRLEFVGTPLIGYVFNRARSSKRDAYTYSYKEPSRKKPPLRPRPRSTDPVTVPRSQ
jgi:Mrp family chromosome partitioning ATPase